MTLDEILTARRPNLLQQWLEVIRSLFPPEAARFLERERDPFANPVGETMREAAEALVDRLCRPPTGEPCPPLERLMRLLAVQGIPPSRALGFVQSFKRIVRAELSARRDGGPLVAELEEVGDRLDQIMLEAAELYITYREQLSVLKLNETRRATQKLMERLQRSRPNGADVGADAPVPVAPLGRGPKAAP